MLREPHPSPVIRGTRGALHLNGRYVGNVVVQGWDASWTYGQFQPTEGFADFAAVYGRWSLLMHEDTAEPVSDVVASALRDAEQQMDTIRARVFFPDQNAWHDVAQLNLDGELIEWKEV